MKVVGLSKYIVFYYFEYFVLSANISSSQDSSEMLKMHDSQNNFLFDQADLSLSSSGNSDTLSSNYSYHHGLQAGCSTLLAHDEDLHNYSTEELATEKI